MSERDPLEGLQLKKELHNCGGCGAELKMVDQGEHVQPRWLLYHAEPQCEWFGKRVAERQRQREHELQQQESEQRELDARAARARAAIDAAVARRGGRS